MAVTLDYEHQLGDVVMGIDEAGRGPLAGGVYAAAVTVPLEQADTLLTGAWREINDSKKLTERKRDRLAEIIKTTPGCVWAIAQATPTEIDRLNILRATHLAMRRAAEEVARQIGEFFDSSIPRFFDLANEKNDGATCPIDDSKNREIEKSLNLSILVDGLAVPTLPFPSRNLVKGDAKSLFIAAASILAKTARDADCLRLDQLYPGYGFAQHKGYPTPAHLAALAKLGPCPEHRRSFGPVSQMELALV